ncbi:leishmanolysin-like peptidase [Corticium candelabrum]|uniref:leishmanolysin-like peptidase n=1 Tax=Corticium candelabrum TaxID=121492 RepID=UPI002E269003|nr:leishmanolysin-like peptidase [Corticium candelabrum]
MLQWWFHTYLAIGTASILHPHKDVSHLPLDPHHVLAKRSFDQQLRFSVFYDNTVEGLDSTERALVKDKLVTDAVKYWSQVLKVKQTTSTILLNRDCAEGRFYIRNGEPRHCERSRLRPSGCSTTTTCGTVTVPSSHLQACYSCTTDLVTKKLNCEKEASSTAGVGVGGADYVLYVSSAQTSQCGSNSAVASDNTNIAYAGHCQQEQALDRPVAGYMNLCPNLLSAKSEDYVLQLAVVKHEMLHALGFSSQLYAFYRDKSGQPRTERDDNNLPGLGLISRYEKVLFCLIDIKKCSGIYQWNDSTIKSITRPQWRVTNGVVSHVVKMIVTPTVQQAVRDHFSCQSLEGAEIENQGGTATRLSHWEKRVFENEAMTGTFTQNPVFSNVTFALLEDTGWYEPDYSLAQNLDWGKGLGCKFVQDSCGGWMDDKRAAGKAVSPFCQILKVKNPLSLRCTTHRLAVALCNLVEYSDQLERDYQYFSSIPGESIDAASASMYGGFVALADYCPFDQEFTWTSQGVPIRGSQCRFTANSPDANNNLALEEYGSSSICIDQGGSWWKTSATAFNEAVNWGSGCYKVSCNSSSDEYMSIYVNGHRYPCHREREEVRVSEVVDGFEYTGSLICPERHNTCWGIAELTPGDTSSGGNGNGKGTGDDNKSGGTSMLGAGRLWLSLIVPVVLHFIYN